MNTLKKTGINSGDLKMRNRGLVLKLLITGKAHTRIDLSKATGLTKMTLSNIINEFIELKYVGEEEPEYNNRVGRNPISIGILPSAPRIIGVNIARDNVTAMLCDLKLNIINRDMVELKDETIDTLKEKLIQVIDNVKEKNYAGIGVSSIGPLDAKKGVILNPTNFFEITDFNVTEFLYKYYHRPVFLNNDMKTAALCEKTFGSGRDLSEFLYVGISNGVGSGLITGDKLYQQGGLSGEIGHVSIDYNGEVCSCSNKGCLETYISIPVVTKRLCEATGLELSFKELCQIDTAQTDEVFRDVISKLSYALVSQTNMLNPSGVIIGHEGAWLNDRYLLLLENILNDTKLSKQHSKVSVLKAEYGVEAPLYGSSCLVLERVFKGELI